MTGSRICKTPDETFGLGRELGGTLHGGEVVMLTGGLGAGKTLLTKGILDAIDFDIDEVTSPSFSLVNLYKTDKFDVFHIDLWRLDEGTDIAFAVGLSEILEDENAVVVVEWAERLGSFPFSRQILHITIEGDGDDPRNINIGYSNEMLRFPTTC